jgi:hypothetical protein
MNKTNGEMQLESLQKEINANDSWRDWSDDWPHESSSWPTDSWSGDNWGDSHGRD